MPTFLRITRHPMADGAEAWLRSRFGDDLQIVTRDTVFGADPVGAVKDIAAEIGGEIVGAEIISPLLIVARLLDARLPFPLLRSEWKRDTTGRVIVAGSDEHGRAVFTFDRFTRLVRVLVEVEELT